MNISSINSGYNSYQNNSYYNNENVAFKSISYIPTEYDDPYDGRVRESQINTSLRKDLDYKEFAKTIRSYIEPKVSEQTGADIKEKNRWGILKYLSDITLAGVDKTPKESICKKAKIYSLAGADGTEAYAIANAVIGEFGFETAKKYVFPIYVSDVDEYVINEYGKAGIVDFSDDEIKKLSHIKDFLTKIEYNKQTEIGRYALKPEFKECFVFESKDLQTKISELPKQKEDEVPFLVLRNCLVQAFDWWERREILNRISGKYPQNAVVVLGQYDLNRMDDGYGFRGAQCYSAGLLSIGNNCFKTNRI